jgi:hypothetical protein
MSKLALALLPRPDPVPAQNGADPGWQVLLVYCPHLSSRSKQLRKWGNSRRGPTSILLLKTDTPRNICI